jgi:hypothetical protein
MTNIACSATWWAICTNFFKRSTWNIPITHINKFMEHFVEN